MFGSVPIDQYLPASVRRDLAVVVRQHLEAKHRIRVVRIHVLDLAPIIDKVVAGQCAPFQPTICGYPVAPWEKAEIGVFAVADDDTPLSIRHDGRVEETL
jgi:hypothetical protein